MLRRELKIFAVAGSVLVLSGMLLAGCDHRLEQEQARQDMVSPADTDNDSNIQAMSLSQAASAAPYNESDMKHKAQKIDPNHRGAEVAGRYTGVMHCKQDSSSCSKGDIDVTLTLFADGSAMRTLAQQGLINSMLERETAFWQFDKDGQHILVYLPDNEVLKFSMNKAHQLTLQDVGSMQQSEDVFGVVFSMNEPDSKQHAYTLTRQAAV